MAAQLFTIDKIEGNSNIGVPVFSRFGKMQNYNFLVMSPVKKEKVVDADASKPLIEALNDKFKIQPNANETVKKEGEKLKKTVIITNEVEKKNEELVHGIMVKEIIFNLTYSIEWTKQENYVVEKQSNDTLRPLIEWNICSANTVNQQSLKVVLSWIKQ